MVSLSKDLFLIKSFKQIWKIGRNSQQKPPAMLKNRRGNFHSWKAGLWKS